MKQNIEIKFSLHDIVNIVDLKIKGIVTAIWIGDKGIQYNVRYLWQGQKNEVYFYEWELEKINKGDKIK